MKTKPYTTLPRPVRIGANAAIAGLWLWLYRPVLDYLAIVFSRHDFRTNQVVLEGASRATCCAGRGWPSSKAGQPKRI